MSFRWVFTTPENEEAVSDLQDQLGVPPKIARLLALRGIDTYEKAEAFFRSDLSQLHDPFLMKDMDKATSRLAEAIRNGERILIYGDYDVDGTTSTAILYIFLEEFGVDVDFYIPHRFKEGYGINQEGIQYAIDTNTDLIVSVDCGITAVEETEQAKEQGIDVIICDHHNVGDAIPDAVAVLDPKRSDCNYPCKGLSGAGVGFKLIQGTIKKLGLADSIAFKLLDLVAISIASDIVPIEDENRILMREGLKRINSEPRIGIKALLELINLSVGSITTSNIVFSIGPRINAAGRMGDATKAVKLLISDTPAEAKSRAHELESINVARRDKDSETMEEAKAMVDKNYNLDKISSMVLHHPDWHLGVIGIVASRLVDTYGRPAVMLSTVDGKIKGSARSIDGFNIYEAFKECEDLLEQFGGHEYAAGLTIASENLEEFRQRINDIAAERLSDEDFKSELKIDCELDLSDVNMRFWKLLSQFEPFGPGNLRPIFVSRDVEVVGVPTIVGKGHLKMKVKQNGSGAFDVIGFNMHEYLPVIRNGDDNQLNIAYSLEENEWNGRRTLQIRLRDVEVE
ncbi:single-stranded-DNA-specific exonuclease RecJ [Fodinibius sp.]|uniref:single-stranded-DNA-specific exonuclease RecJ n=1 Tax=Fodinibius sp. TaxID=1872440 RepID=UPI002ACE495B|nr:single-stranded-DNA-specific exonuclease RecJ [Fodinibius sp.]MDZ7659934.1 single-stranded-DNA-specific exonuclease RecJ [Fodinibius sp.]